MNDKLKKRLIRKKRVRSKIVLKEKKRFSVFRSSKHIYAQIIDDRFRKTLVAASDIELKRNGKQNKVKMERCSKNEKARLVGELLAQKALEKGIKSVVFDRGPYKYHGRVKALAEGARKGGLKF